MGLGTKPFEKGVIDLGDGNWAWLQPDGGWGWSNAGLIVDGDEALLVDTLFDLSLTRDMLDGFAAAVPGARIRTLVNTHSNGDHCNGNELVIGAEVVTSVSAADEMAHERPEVMVAMLAAAEAGELGPTGDMPQDLVDGSVAIAAARFRPRYRITGQVARDRAAAGRTVPNGAAAAARH